MLLNEEIEIRITHKAKVTLLLHLKTEIEVSDPFYKTSDKGSAFDFHSMRTGTEQSFRWALQPMPKPLLVGLCWHNTTVPLPVAGDGPSVGTVHGNTLQCNASCFAYIWGDFSEL